MYLASKAWYLAGVEETETFDELFSLVGLFFNDHWSTCLASANALGYTTGLPLVLEKNPMLEKKLIIGFIPLQATKCLNIFLDAIISYYVDRRMTWTRSFWTFFVSLSW